MLVIALMSAQKETGATKEQVKLLQDAVIGYWKRNKPWPDGF